MAHESGEQLMTIIDRRQSNKNKSVENRQKFLKRYKRRIKKSVDKIASEKKLTDILKERKVTVDNIEEPNFNFDLTTGDKEYVFPGNKHLGKGDKVHRQSQSDGKGTDGSQDGDGLDEFTFVLSKEEFLDLYFSDMALPDFIKESLKGTNKYKFKRTGYSKDGIPARLDLVKTLKQALARRIATGKKRYLDDIDLRYKHYTKQPYPIRHAVMILLMDVSASMGEWEKTIAKKFFLLLYLFLHKVYKKVDLIFVSHTQTAKKVTEEEFFYGRETGGTIVSSGLELVNNIIDKEINLSTTNVYISQASDGDNWSGDENLSTDLLKQLLQKVQYFAYIQTEEPHRREYKDQRNIQDLFNLYENLLDKFKNLQIKSINDASQVYPVLRELFDGKRS